MTWDDLTEGEQQLLIAVSRRRALGREAAERVESMTEAEFYLPQIVGRRRRVRLVDAFARALLGFFTAARKTREGEQ